jgi:hypothetical protein
MPELRGCSRFLDPRDWAGSAEAYLRHLGILKV